MGDFSVSGFTVWTLCGNVKNPATIPAGKGFEIQAQYTIVNSKPGAALQWATCLTVWNVTDNKATGKDFCNTHFGSGGLVSPDAVNVIMPAKLTKYKVKLFATQYATPSPNHPPEDKWK